MNLARWLIGAVGLKIALAFVSTDLIRMVFCWLPARLAAAYYDVPLVLPELAFRAHGVTLVVAPSCAGTDFFAMALSLLAVGFGARRRAFVVLALPAALILTLTLNAFRLIALVPVESVFPKREVPIVHLAVGVVFFLPVLCLLWYTLLGKGKPYGNA